MAKTAIDKIVEQMPWLDGVADKVQPAIEETFKAGGESGKKVKDFLNGVWLGHPLHPMLTDVPIGAWTMAQMFDAISLFDGESTDLEKAADIAVGVGVVSAVGAAVAGVADWSDIHQDPARRTGMLHALLNSAGLVLNIASLVVRVRGGNRGVAWFLSATGYGVAASSAWIGGDLVYKMGMIVNRNAWVKGPKKFTDAIAEDDLEDGKPVRVHVGDSDVVLLKHEDGLHAFAAICPHLGGPLEKGEIDGHIVTCPWHQSKFDIRDGQLLDGPATTPLPCFEARRLNGQIQVRLEQPTGAGG